MYYNSNRSSRTSHGSGPESTFFITRRFYDSAFFIPMELKKPTTFDEQLNILEGRNIIIEDREKALEFISNINYYRLTAYALSFKQKDNTYLEGTTFQQIADIYYFDKELRSLIFKIIETIEIHLRTTLSNYHAFHYGAEGYTRPTSFGGNHNHTNFSNHIKSAIKENKTTLVVKHHNDCYNGKFPIWVIIEFFSTGMLSYFYLGMKAADQKAISQDTYNITYSVMKSWLRCLTDLRNRCAHYSRLYNTTFTAVPKKEQGAPYNYDRTVFSQLLMLKSMYPANRSWNEDFLQPLEKLLKKYNNSIDKKCLGFPYRWKSLLKK